jgi:oxygen-independent coproporphyrinogen-3 oxidase
LIPSERDAGVYVHFPYCERKCPYCDFNVHAIPHDDRTYADAIIAELRARGPAFRPSSGVFSTLYFGGGTPSEWSPGEVARVIEAVRSDLGLARSAEITLEANPGTVSEQRLDQFRAGGVTRFSLGVQSFRSPELELLGRTHSPAEAEAIAVKAKRTGAMVSIDLIYGLTAQTEAEVTESIDCALGLEPDHVSAYTLTIEPETPLAKRTRLGLYRALDDDRQADLYAHVTAKLERAGYQHYEVSSYAPAGKEAVHNSIYWTGGAYLGVGAGAHSYLPASNLVRAIRRENVRAPEAYLKGARAGTFPASFEERLEGPEVIGDRLLTGVRARWGVDLAALDRSAELAGRLLQQLEPAVDRLVKDGLIEREGGRIRPSPRGFLWTDRIARELLAALRS